MSDWTKRRFWKDAAAVAGTEGWTVELDGRGVRTPGKAPLVMPSRALAEAVAGEWAAQEEGIRPDTMPLTRAANSAIDKVIPQRAAILDMLGEYGGTDLLCYRAEGPDSLVHEQQANWDPHLDWAEAEFGAPLLRVEGLIPQPQPKASLARLRDATEGLDAFALTAFHDFVTLPGSLVLGLALLHGRIDAAEAMRLSELDALWQERFWGTDEEAAAVRARREAQLGEAVRFLDLTRTPD